MHTGPSHDLDRVLSGGTGWCDGGKKRQTGE
jgi:hypothetical protein